MDEAQSIHLSILLQVAAIVIQFGSAYIALRLIRVTGRSPAWLLIASALCFMAVRRSIGLARVLTGGQVVPGYLLEESVVLVISLIMLAGVLAIRPLFLSIKQAATVLQQDKGDLEIKVAERTGKLVEANAELRREIEGHRAAEMAVEAERQRLFALLDGLPAMVHLKAPDFSVRFANRVFREIFGDWEGRRCFEVVQGRNKPCKDCPSSSVFETGKANSLEWNRYNQNQVYQMHNYPFTDVDGSPLVLTMGIDITQRKQAEEAVQQQLAFQQVLLDTIPVPIFYKDAKGLYLGCNKAFETFFGLSQKEIIGKSVYAVSPKEISDVYHAKDRELLEYPGTQVYDFVSKDTAGNLRKVVFHKATFLDHAGSVGGIIGGILDITDRQKAEEEIRLNEARSASLLRISQYPSESIQELLHYALDEAITLTGSKIGYIYLYDEVTQQFTLNTWSKEVMQECTIAEPQTVYQLEKTGIWGEAVRQARPIMVNDFQAPNPLKKGYPEGHAALEKYLTIPVFISDRIVAVVAVANKASDYDEADVRQLTLMMDAVWNIAERKRVEEALKESEREYRLLVKAIPAIVFRGYADWSVEFFDDKIEELTGYAKEEFNSRRLKWCDLILEDDLNQAKQDFLKALKDDGAYLREYRIRKREGAILWIGSRGRIVFKPDGQIDHVTGVFYDISERKAAGEALRVSEEKYRLLVEQIPAVVFKGYADWSVDFYDNKIEAITGYSKDDFDSRRVLWCDLIPPEDQGYAEEVFREALKTNRSYVREHRIRRKDGEIRWVQCRGRIFCDYKGNVEYIHGVTFDITDRRRAEEALRQSEARLAEAQRLARLGHWEWDIQSDKVLWSEEVYRIFGLKAEAFTPTRESMQRYMHPEDEARVISVAKEALAGKKALSLVGRIVRPDGSVRYVHSQAEVLCDKSGRPQRLLGTAQDITERRTAEMRLRDSEERFRAIFDSAALGITLTDMQGTYLATNTTYREMLGYGEDELRGKNFTEFTHADDVEMNRQVFRELQSGKRDYYQIEKRYSRKDGQSFQARVTVSQVKDAEGLPLYAIGMVEDITQAKQAEENLQESEKRLRYLATQLITAQEDERKRISRELHDELGQALLVLKLQTRAIHQRLGPKQQVLKQASQEMLTNLDQVVDNIRRLSRDLSPAILEDLGLSAALQHLIRGFRKHYRADYCAQETNLDGLFPYEAQITIYRIFQECLTNIGKHSGADLIMVFTEKTADRVSFVIQDNGKGFDPVRWRLQGSDRGMGLAAMEERARMVGGSLSIWSQVGSGTKISCEIPYSRQRQ